MIIHEYLRLAAFTTRNTRIDSKPMAHMMMPLYRTASFLVQANMSMDKGVPILTRKTQSQNFISPERRIQCESF